MSGLRPGFLRMGVTAASLREGGTEGKQREELTMLEISGKMVGKQCFTKEDGMGSSMQVEVFMVEMIEDSSAGETGANLERGGVEKGGGGGGEEGEMGEEDREL